jgi:hypothetical protein
MTRRREGWNLCLMRDFIDATSGEDAAIAPDGEAVLKLSRQQRRAMARQKRTASGWTAALGTTDPWLRQAIQAALGPRAVTRAELEAARGMSLAEPDRER